MYSVNDFMVELKQYRHLLSKQTIKTIRGQALAGDITGARKGLEKVLNKKQSSKDRMINAHRNTRYMLRQYDDIDYKGQLTLSLSNK